jgi:glycosyltransferase involved in cell wall biosynthesis/cyclopropane fatty-acyl-phospholipid synthase-like methyltransferase
VLDPSDPTAEPENTGPPSALPALRVGVLVVAYNAASTLATTLARLPDSFATSVDHVLVCDDASTDDTYAVGLQVKESSPLPITVIRHERNLGYGGNQKVGYEWAIDHGLDLVVLLHADGQYAPEEIERLVAPLASGTADAVFGSRMMVRGQARAGGMPAYKYVGNRILTAFQNKLTGARLSEWHSGYRAYRVDALTDLPLASYSDGFDFDTEIILGLLAAEKRIVEVPIPTYYGDEICYVNGLAYARDVSADVVRHWASARGFGGGVSSTETDTYALKEDYGSHAVLLRWLCDRPTSRVLDAGCFDGRFADLARQRGHHVTGLDRQKLDGVAQRVDAFIEADLNDPLPHALRGAFDVVVAGDILEHVVEPHSLLDDLVQALRPGGEILVSVPNFGHWYPRGRTALGKFDYDQRGPLDRGHIRFFTRDSVETLIANCGLRITDRATVGTPFDTLAAGGSPRRERLASGAARTDRVATRVWPRMFGYQFLYRLEVM